VRRLARRVLGPCVLLACVHPAFAHGGESHPGLELLTNWPFEPLSTACLALSGYLYIRGLRQFWKVRRGTGIKRWEAACFGLGWLFLFIALLSPLHPFGSVLFSAHMTQHEILMLAAAPLMVLGRPLVVFLRALPARWSGSLARASNRPAWHRTWALISAPLAAWLIHAAALWVWHIPSLFQATITSEPIHIAQHASFFLTALLFWWAAMERRGPLGYGLGVLAMFTTAMHSGVLGALITFAGSVLYPIYQGRTEAWGLTALEDQQLGGLIMWVPAGILYIIAGLCLAAGCLRESERRAASWQPATPPAPLGS
jgi:putative membrane protein